MFELNANYSNYFVKFSDKLMTLTSKCCHFICTWLILNVFSYFGHFDEKVIFEVIIYEKAGKSTFLGQFECVH